VKDVAAALGEWRAAGVPSAFATVIAVRRSAPRPPGAKMAIAQDGRVVGMVSGGCVEGAVIMAAEEVLAGAPPRLLHFGVADEEAWEIGLPCGGEIDVWVDRLDDEPALEFAQLARNGGRGVLITRLDDGRRMLVDVDAARHGSLGGPGFDAAAQDAALDLVWGDSCEQRDLFGVPLFFDVTTPAPRVIIVGAIDLAEELARLCSFAGWRAFVTDPRSRFATAERFPSAERVVAGWPAKAITELGGVDRATSIVVLTHDPKIDDAALQVALHSDAQYIGVMGSRRMQEGRRARMLELGFTPSDLERLSGPVGLDLGAVTPQETAVSIMAEMVAVWRGRLGGRLRESQAPRIHEVGA
jgi:xanthine dehydrogenase accessory factor